MNYEHASVMTAEVLSALQPKTGGRYVDGTLGGAGHAAAILRASEPTGWLYGFDRDGDAIEAASERLRPFAGRFELRRENFSELDKWVPAESCDGVVLDLGVSGPQLEWVERGFSFRGGPLDMRMDRRTERTAADLVNESEPETLAKWFWEYGGERESRRFAREIVKQRSARPFQTTADLAELISRLSPRHGRKTHPATRVFQALRIAVNDEIGSLQKGLAAAVRVLKPGGRLAVISFHSLEDRIVKEFGREQARPYTFPGEVDVPELRVERRAPMQWLSRKAVLPTEAEVAANPRSRSAQLRILQKN